MHYLYRFVNPFKETIEYVGIIHEDNRTLKQRVNEHLKKDPWCWDVPYKVEYIECDYSRTDLEHIESHLISLYGTGKYYNKAKRKWGTSVFIPDLENKWQYYDVINAHLLDEELDSMKKRVEKLNEQCSFYKRILNYIKSQRYQIQTLKRMCINNAN